MDVVYEQMLKTLSSLQQCLSQELDYLGQNCCESTLWMANRGDTSISAINVRETETEIVLQVEIPNVLAETISLQVMPETVCMRGKCKAPLPILANRKDPFGFPRFQHVIPLPVLVEPNTAIAEIDDETLTIRLQKSGQSRQPVTVKICDRWKLPTELVSVESAGR